MAHTTDERERRLAERERALDARAARFNEVQSTFNAASAADRDRQRSAWAELDVRQKRLAAEWEEATRFHAEQAVTLDARAAELAARDKSEADTKAKLQREVASLREEAAALDARARNTRQLVDELEQRRAELRAAVLAPIAPGAEPPSETRVALDRTADRDLDRWATELAEREERLNQERAAVQALVASVTAEKATLADSRRVLTEQFAQLAGARALWQEAEHATVEEMEQLARTLRRREGELDVRESRLTRADVRRRTDAYELWQLRLRLEAWQSKVVAYEMRWHTEREQIETDIARREVALAEREAASAGGDEADAIPFALAVADSEVPAVPAELVGLRDELERMAAVLLEAELPEQPDPPDSELPWGAEPWDVEEVPTAVPIAEPGEADVLLFDPVARAA